MNVSQPISSSLEKVNFGVLSSEEIRKLSVKRVTSSQTFDRLLHPINGGLYDPAFGAFTDHACTTCFLDQNHCPGHCGHIDLPFPVYHVLFMDQAFRLFRAQCASCRGFRLSRVEVNLFWCKLRLIRYGLLKEAHEVEDIGVSAEDLKNTVDLMDGNSSEDENEDDSDQRAVISARRAFVSRAIKKFSKKLQNSTLVESEAISEARKTVIRDFIASLSRGRKCARCKMVTPSYRKNAYIGIFRKPLPAKDRAYNAQQGRVAAENPLVALNRIKEKERKQREQAARGMEVDEGVADMDSPDEDQIRVFEGQPEIDGASTSESDGEDISQSRGASPDATDQAGQNTSQKKVDQRAKEPEVFVDAGWVHASLTQLFENEREILTQIYGSMTKSGELATPSPDQFFISCLVVPPNKYRKESRTGQDEIAESSDNEGYKMVLNACDELLAIRREMQGHETTPGRSLRGYDQLRQQWLALQNAVNTLIDSDKSGLSGAAALRVPEGIKQKLEKKEGMFRMNIMGKRVNFAARSVISPDPNIETREIGIPPVFARKLTYPEPVTPWSFEELKQAVVNGATKWPGAVAIENENGQIVNLRRKTQDERAALANLLLAPSSTSVTGVRPKKVHRHLNNGDIVIMNRQPTLHKPSMMAHRARVLPGEKTIRMHYANCNTYNADFDGDEMNMHFPQNEIARAEALEIADTDHQYLSATAGNPLRGLIQDHISMGVWLTCLDTFFGKEDYQELLYSALRPEDDHTPGGRRIILLEPALIKPVPRWTGKQIISTILINIRPDTHAGIYSASKCSTPADRWGKGSQEGILQVVNNDMVTGILDKKQIGPSREGLIHTVYEAYGHKAAGSLLSTLGRLLTRLESMRAFSCGVEDLVLTQKGEADRTEKLSGAKTIGLTVASKYVSLEDEHPEADDPELLGRLEMVLRDDKKQAGLDSMMNSTSRNLSAAVTEACLPNGLVKKFPKNQMQAMTTSGAKGSMVNANLISCNLGQQVLEGRRVPIMASGKSLPSFKPFDSSVRAGGYIVDRFLTGVRPQEYYFHAMAGREGLIDTAVKTSRSGYLQRCVIKGMEGLRAEYDTTVRDSDGSIVQYLYGEDGLDITRQSSLFDLTFFTKNFLSLFAGLNARDEQHVISDEAREWTKKAYKAYHKTANLGAMDPALAVFPPGAVGGSISEKFHTLVKNYLDTNPDGTLKDKVKKTGEVPRSTFRALCDINYMKAVVQPGEAIGVVAGQSIGEPSTQMTLNTFHLAGHSAKNVTLGIPRLREILMTASQNIKTPTMSLYLNPEMTDTDGERFAKGISRLSLAELIDDVAITETVGQGIYPESRKYNVVIKFYPSKDYIEGHAITIDDVVETVEHKFVPSFRRIVKAEFKRRNESKEPDKINKGSSNSGIGKPVGRIREEEAAAEAENEGGDSDEDNDGDDDATTMKKRGQRDEGLTYEDPDEDEMEIERQGEREASPQAENAATQPVDEGYGGSPGGSQASDSEDEEDPQKAAKRAAKDRAARIINDNAEISHFAFDDTDGQICSITFEYPASRSKLLLQNFVQRAASLSYVQAIPGIAAAVYQKEEDQEGSPYLIFTEGVNFVAMREYQNVIDPHRMYTNDVGAVLRTYGVEAARDTIIRELNGVFKGHSISVDRRHLTLVADYMTRSGGYSAFSRIGMAHKTSPFAKMSFETTAAFLRDAVTEGDVEELASPSARITVGKIGQIGTGMCDVLMPVS